MAELNEIVATLRQRIARYGKTRVNEQNTKATLIAPLLRALGWDVEDLDDVHLEYKQKPKQDPVDYALMLSRSPCLFVEAKALGESLSDEKWAKQVMGYASIAGVEWVILTDGDAYHVFNSHAPVPIEQKLFRKVRISDDATRPAETLALLSKAQMRERQISRLWDAHFVDRQVQCALRELLGCDGEPDDQLVRLLARRIATLSPGKVKAGLRRLEVQVTCPTTVELKKPSRTERTSPQKLRRSKATGSDVSLGQLIDVGLIAPPLQLFKTYKGIRLQAEVRPDGSVFFNNSVYNSCSSAAEHARGSVVGGKPNTNGWAFWKYRAPDGRDLPLDHLRKQFTSKDG